jgi:hypothetical protein
MGTPDRAKSAHRRATEAWWLIVLGAIAAFGCIRPLATIAVGQTMDYNENWNAYQAAVAWSGANPYHDLGARYVNNYPPLSFYVVGLVGRLLGNNVVAGRLVSLAAFAAIACGIAVTMRILDCTKTEAAFSALVFVASMTLFDVYVGMDDPQLLGQAVAIAGFVIVVRDPRSASALPAGAFLLATALFIKHNLVAQPIALLLWLIGFDRRAALKFAVYGGLFGGLGLAAGIAVFGCDFVTHVFAARPYSLDALRRGATGWLTRQPLSALVAVLLFASRPRDHSVALCALYAGVSVVVGAFFIGGADVDVNVMFDADIALAMSAGLALNRAARLEWRFLPPGALGRSGVAGCYVVSLLLAVSFNATTVWGATCGWTIRALAAYAAAPAAR